MKTMRETVDTAKVSVAKYVKKGLAVTLAAVMLTACLASCDEFDKQGYGSPSYGTDTSESAESWEPIELETVPYYDKMVLRDFELIDIFSELNFIELFKNNQGIDKILENYPKFLQFAEDYQGEIRVPGMDINFYYQLMSVSNNRNNVAWELQYESADHKWTHTLVSTEDDFALVSKSQNGGRCIITGFVDGRIYDEACFLGSEDFNALVDLVNSNGYYNVMNQIRDEFWGRAYLRDLIKKEESEDSYWDIQSGYVFADNNGVVKNASEFNYYIIDIGIKSTKDDKKIATIIPTYDISNNYIQVLTGEISLNPDRSSGNGTTNDTWEPVTRPAPDVQLPPSDAFSPPGFWEDGAGNDESSEEETTEASTEAEIEPEIN